MRRSFRLVDMTLENNFTNAHPNLMRKSNYVFGRLEEKMNTVQQIISNVI